MHLKNGVLRDLRKSMYNKIIELPISYYSEKERRYHGTYAWGCKRSAKLLSHFRTSYKRTLLLFLLGTMFIISTKLTLFVLIFIISGWIISKLAKNLRAKSLEAQKKVVN
jgi:subfamily B ATP-binding cassette protein MsbA